MGHGQDKGNLEHLTRLESKVSSKMSRHAATAHLLEGLKQKPDEVPARGSGTTSGRAGTPLSAWEISEEAPGSVWWKPGDLGSGLALLLAAMCPPTTAIPLLASVSLCAQ